MAAGIAKLPRRVDVGLAQSVAPGACSVSACREAVIASPVSDLRIEPSATRYARRHWTRLPVILIAISIAVPRVGTAAEFTARVVGIVDGDTITVVDARNVELSVRLEGIDAPERSQPFGRKSKRNLSGLVYGKVVTVTSGNIDRWGRLVGKVAIGGRDVNLKQLLDGYAWHFKRYEREQTIADRSLYRAAEQRARSMRLGIWMDSNPIPPWKWRVVKRLGRRPSYWGK